MDTHSPLAYFPNHFLSCLEKKLEKTNQNESTKQTEKKVEGPGKRHKLERWAQTDGQMFVAVFLLKLLTPANRQ